MFIQCIIIDVYWQSFFRPWQNCDFFIKKTTLPDSTPTKTQNRIVSNLEKPDEIKESTAINLRLLPFHASRMITTAAIFPENLKESKDLSYMVEYGGAVDEALGYLTNIRRLLQGAAP